MIETQRGEARSITSLSRLLLEEAFNEILVFDALTLKVVESNHPVRANLQYTRQELKRLGLRDVFIDKDIDASSTQPFQNKELATRLQRKNGTTFKTDVRLLAAEEKGRSLLVALMQNPGSLPTNRKARNQRESDFQALVTNMPGMAYQARLDEKGAVTLTFVSANSRKLLGVKPQTLQANPALLLDLIVPDDVPSYRNALGEAHGGHLTFNWEGRIWVDAWKDIKWINIRTSQRNTNEGVVWDGIILNITQSKLAREQLEHSREELRKLALHVERVKEEERKRIAREVHDELGGNLTAIKIGVSWLSRNADKEPSQTLKRLDYINEIVDGTLDAIHRISSDLRPSILDFGIVSALRWQTEQLCRSAGIDCRFFTKLKLVPLDDETSIAVFRIAQEALTNIAKHAKATQAEVHLGVKGGTLHMEIVDNGIGPKLVNHKQRKRSFGLIGMTERASALGGRFHMEHRDSGGTRISLDIPLLSGKAGQDTRNDSEKPIADKNSQVGTSTRR